jgi:hypothetical protein
MRDSSLFIFTEQQRKGAMYCTTVNVVTETIKENPIHFEHRNESKVTCISAGNHFVYITAGYRSREMSIYDFTSEQPVTYLRCQFSREYWRDLTTGMFRTIKLENIDPERETELDALAKNNKIYVNNGSILLVMNNHIDSTHIVNFDLEKQKVHSWIIDHNPGRVAFKTGYYSDNSFFFRNKLYYVQATNDSLMMQVVDPFTKEIIKTYTTVRGNEIAWKNTPIIQERVANNKIKDPRDLNKTSQLLRNMISGNAVIAAKPYGNDQIEVVVGSYEKTVTTTVVGGYNGFNQMRPYSYPGPMMYSSRSSQRFMRDTWTQSAHFKMLLNGDNYSHTPGEPGSSAYERIERYTASMKIEPEMENIFVTNGQYYYAYYDKAARKLVVLKF